MEKYLEEGNEWMTLDEKKMSLNTIDKLKYAFFSVNSSSLQSPH